MIKDNKKGEDMDKKTSPDVATFIDASVQRKLMRIQGKLKAPKSLRNTFGNYNYRNAEGILEAVKPLLSEYGLILTLSDDIRQIGDRFYIVATAKITEVDTMETVEVTAMARESLTKKGMDDSQITGTASSYARKYAMNGLFLLDDTKDADTDEYHNQINAANKQTTRQSTQSKAAALEILTTEMVAELKELCSKAGREESYIAKSMGAADIKDITPAKYPVVKAGLLKIINSTEKE